MENSSTESMLFQAIAQRGTTCSDPNIPLPSCSKHWYGISPLTSPILSVKLVVAVPGRSTPEL
jgi:hypothetical protein